MAYAFFHLVVLLSCWLHLLPAISLPSSSFPSPWSFTLNASQSTCTDLQGNVSSLCFVPSSNASVFTLSILVSGYNLDHLNPQIVWTVNRNQPVADGAMIELGKDGNLALTHADGVVVWSSHTSGKAVSRIEIDAFYLGRLALYNSTNGTVWSSFDFPRDTVMQFQPLPPGKKLVGNISSVNASEGPYSLVVEPGGLVMYYDTGITGKRLPYWIWGVYGFNDLSHVLETCKHPFGAFFEDYRIVFGEYTNEESNSTSSQLCGKSDFNTDYFNLGDLPAPSGSSLELSFLRVEADGALRSYSAIGSDWLLEYDPLSDQCLLPNRCGPYGLCTEPSVCSCPQSPVGGLGFSQNSSGPGCLPVHPLSFPTSCNLTTNTTNQSFLELEGVEYFPNQYLLPDLTAVTVEECKAACSRNCSCKAVFYYNESRSCFYASDQLWTMRKTNNQSHLAFIKLEQMTTNAVASAVTGNSKKVVAFSTFGGLLFAVLIITLICFFWVKLRNRGTGAREDELALHTIKEEGDLDTINFRRFTFKELEDATSGFTSRKLGAGGFGEVYEGKLPDTTLVAVKNLRNEGRTSFRPEVEGLGTVNHINLVHLMGFCAEESHRLLVYEYMPNGSLDTWIFNPEKILSWDKRLQIAIGTAACLAYLHEGCRRCILHLDIKPQNILLDEKFCAKVSDFGLCELLDRDQVAASLMHKGGTFGYVAPEIWAGETATTKADVYSFGMVLWELASGERTVEGQMTHSFRPAHAFPKVEMGKWDEVIDPSIYSVEHHDERRLLQMKNTIKLAYWCIQIDPDKRPSMNRLLQQLQQTGEEIPDPPPSPNFKSSNLANYLSSISSASMIQPNSLSHAR